MMKACVKYLSVPGTKVLFERSLLNQAALNRAKKTIEVEEILKILVNLKS